MLNTWPSINAAMIRETSRVDDRELEKDGSSNGKGGSSKTPTTRIIGGSEATPYAYSFVVRLYRGFGQGSLSFSLYRQGLGLVVG
jgi:hypothetical protein